MATPNMFGKLIANAFERYSGDVGDALIHLGAVGWFFSAAAQITMIAKNKDIDKKEKKFLIPQEIADGAINVGLYYTVCAGIKKIGEKLLENCVFITEETSRVIKKMRNICVSEGEFVNGLSGQLKDKGLVKNSKGRLTDFFVGSLNYLETMGVKNIKDEKCSVKEVFKIANKVRKRTELKLEIESALKEYKSFKNGVGVIAAVGASVLACNLITPIARNITANYYQKKLVERTKKRNPVVPSSKAYIMAPSKTFNGFKI